ncbi:MAG TPA: porin [Gemmatimonadaceae bacterium]|nr:porin [Gemmatimonadaceae bacterium]
MRVLSIARRAATAAALSVLAAPVFAQGVQRQPTEVPLPGSYTEGYLVFTNPDSSFKYWLDGRLQVDGALYSGSKNSLANGTEVRRARLGGKATLFKDWHGEIDVDFAKNAVEMKDIWIGYLGFTNSMVKFGNYKEPFSLETLTSSKYITFLERSYIDNFSPDRNIGLGYARWGSWWQTAFGAFTQPAGSTDASGRDEGYGLTGRVTFAPINSPGRLVHFGGAISRRTPNGDPAPDTNTMRFRARPETNVSQARFLTTGKIRLVDYATYLNGEFATVYGPASLQAEYTQVDVHRLTGLPTPRFNGGYAFVSFFLTGETRPYLVQEGEFDRVFPKRAIGAFEVAARVSKMDLNDLRTGVNILGGNATNYTVGLNWHINANFKWMLDYTRVTNDKNAKPDMGVAPLLTGDKFNIIQSRFSLAF